jgi:hypothetical protein
VRVEAVGVQSGADRLLDVLVRQPMPPREHLDGVSDEKVQQNQERIEFHLEAFAEPGRSALGPGIDQLQTGGTTGTRTGGKARNECTACTSTWSRVNARTISLTEQRHQPRVRYILRRSVRDGGF